MAIDQLLLFEVEVLQEMRQAEVLIVAAQGVTRAIGAQLLQEVPIDLHQAVVLGVLGPILVLLHVAYPREEALQVVQGLRLQEGAPLAEVVVDNNKPRNFSKTILMKTFLTFILGLLCSLASAQNLEDVLRLTDKDWQGTPRFQSMAGAFGALGGELSALNINPAGSAVFANHQFTVTGTFYNGRNNSSYFGSNRRQTTDDFDINQSGTVLVFKNGNKVSPWKKIALAFNYDITENFDDRIFARGDSNQGIDNYFLQFADGLPFGSLLLQQGEYIEDAYLDIGERQGYDSQQAFLGYYGGIIDPVSQDDANTSYTTNADYSSLDQEFSRRSYGYNSKFTFNVSTSYEDWLFLGSSLNFQTVFYEQFDALSENGFNADSPIQNTYFDNYLGTQGSGFNFSLGALGKVSEMVRLGLSYRSPTWYRLSDETSQRIDSDLADEDIGYINYGVVNLFEEYRIKTPSKFTGSLALIFGKRGLLSMDYSYQNLARAVLRPENDPSFQIANQEIDQNLHGVSTLRFGGEYRIKSFSFRGGYRYVDSPVKNGYSVGHISAFSGGLGFSFGPNRLDFSLVQTEQEKSIELLPVGLPKPARVGLQNTNFALGYVLNF